MQSRNLAACAIAALLMSAANAEAREVTQTGTLSAGDYSITMTLPGYKPFDGYITFEGAELTGVDARFSTAALFRRAVYPDPITYTLVPIEIECSALVGETCIASTGVWLANNLTSNGLRFSFPTGLALTGLASPPTPDSQKIYWYAGDGVSTLDFSFGPATGDVNYTLTYDAHIPEPAVWAFLVGGFGVAGTALRRTARGGAGGTQSGA